MNCDRPRLKIIARIPDLNVCRSDEPYDEGWSNVTPASTGRLLSQGLSFKLLAGMALALVVGAMLPFSFSARLWDSDSPSGADSMAAAWQPSAPVKQPEAAPAAATAMANTAPAAAQPASRPAILVAARPEKASAPPILPATPPATQTAVAPVTPPVAAPPTMPAPIRATPVAPPLAETNKVPATLPPQAPNMSAWPNPSPATVPPPVVSNGDSRVSANQPISVYPAQYQADPRSVYRPEDVRPAPMQGNPVPGNTENSSTKRYYDRTRPGVY